MTYETCEKGATWADDIPQRHFLVTLDLLVVDAATTQGGVSGSG